jgi:ABC-type multidrug transport system permease subunit
MNLGIAVIWRTDRAFCWLFLLMRSAFRTGNLFDSAIQSCIMSLVLLVLYISALGIGFSVVGMIFASAVYKCRGLQLSQNEILI